MSGSARLPVKSELDQARRLLEMSCAASSTFMVKRDKCLSERQLHNSAGMVLDSRRVLSSFLECRCPRSASTRLYLTEIQGQVIVQGNSNELMASAQQLDFREMQP